MQRAVRGAEVLPSGSFDPIGAVAEIDPVEVALKDELFGVALLETQRHEQLLDLAAAGVFAAIQEDVADVLLGDGRPAFADPAGADVGPSGAQDRFEVDAVVIPETLVFNRDHCVLHDLGDVCDGHVGAVLFSPQ